MLEEVTTCGEHSMADLIYVTLSDGTGRIINLDHILQICDLPDGNCELMVVGGGIYTIPGSATQIANMPRLGTGQRTI
jgi:hypothetical protein